MYIVKGFFGRPMIAYQIPTNFDEYFEVDSIPEWPGDGWVMNADFKTKKVSWVQKYVKKSYKDEEAPIGDKLNALEQRQEFLEDCFAEMAITLYSALENG